MHKLATHRHILPIKHTRSLKKKLRFPVEDDREMGTEVALGLLGTKLFEQEGGGGRSELNFDDVGVRSFARKRRSLKERNPVWC